MGRILATLAGVLVLAVMAAGLTETTLAIGHQGHIVDDTLLRRAGLVAPIPSPTPSAKPKAPKPSATPKATPKATATPTPTPTPVVTVTTNGFVRLRAGKSVNSAVLAELQAGTKLVKLADSNAEWQQVRFNGLSGYVYRSYLTY